MCIGGWKKGGAHEPTDHALGRSRGGLTTKIHLIVDGRGLPLGVALSAGQRHEATRFVEVLEDSRLPRTRWRGRYRPDRVAADMAYNAEWIREWLWRRGIEPVIPRRSKTPPPDEPFDREAYRGRNIVERCICWLKESRRVFSRYDQLAVSYAACLKLAILQRLPKFDFSDEP